MSSVSRTSTREGALENFEDRNLPKIRLAEVREHNTAHDCWMAIHGRVYDVMPILSKHPGGSQILLKYAGMDATFPFDDVGHSMESLIYDMPSGTLKGLLDPRDRPLHKQHESDYEDPEEKDTECITMGHGQAENSYLIVNRLYTSILYFTIIFCALLLLFVRIRWRPDLGNSHATDMHHQDGASASLDLHQDFEENSIPAWAY